MTSVVPTIKSAEPTGPEANEETLALVKKMADDHRDTCSEVRTQALKDDDYYHCEQLTEWQKSVLRGRGQPDIVINRVRIGVNGILGVIEQGKTDPRAFMRNPPDDSANPAQAGVGGGMGAGQGAPVPQQGQKKPLDAGDVASMSLRYSADINDFPSIKRAFSEDFLIKGIGAVINEVDQANGNEVVISLIPYEEFVYDPRSRKKDFSDARYMGMGKWMYADRLAAKFPEHAELIRAYADGNSTFGAYDSTWEDKPGNVKPWIDSTQKRLMVFELYYTEKSDWVHCVFFCGAILLLEVSPYKDDRGRTTCPINARTCYINRNKERYGVVRDMRGPQDEINARRSKAIHEINSRQLQQVDPNAPPIDEDLARKEAALAGGIIPRGYNIVPRHDVVANNLVMLAEAKSEIERFGPSPAILGRQSADASGRAQQIRQQAGITELSPIIAEVNSWERDEFKGIWAIQRQFWTDEKWIRTTDDLGTPQYVRVNQIVGVQMVVDPQTGQPVQQPIFKNELAKMDVDIVLDMVPDTATLQQEQFNEIIQLIPVYGPQAIPFEIVLEMSSIPKKRQLIDRLEQLRAQATQAAMQNPATQIQLAGEKAKVVETYSKVDVNRATAKHKDVQATTDAMHGHADSQTYAAGHHMSPPDEDTGAMNGSGAPQSSQGPPPG